jgi:hypothetical protein
MEHGDVMTVTREPSYYAWANETGPADQEDAEATLRVLAIGVQDK